jgi:hypothetical protein
MEKIFCAFVNNDQLEVASTSQYGDLQLMVRSKLPLRSSAALTGLEYICFPIPEPEELPPKFQSKFNEEYCFVNEKGRGFIQSGPASLLNVGLPQSRHKLSRNDSSTDP